MALSARFGQSPAIGMLFGALSALFWAIGFVAAKHGLAAGFTPADLAMHRFLWAGILLVPAMFRDGVTDLGGVGWFRGLVLTLLVGPPQAFMAYTGYTIVPLGHGTTIQPSCAALFGLFLATVVLGERPSAGRIAGAALIVGGLVVFGFESLTTIGPHGVGGDLLFASAGTLWATFGVIVRKWQISGLRAALIVGPLSALLLGPLYAVTVGFDNVLSIGWAENLIQVIAQGLVAGIIPVYLFAKSVSILGAGRAATFPALVPVFGVIVGFLALGTVPTLAQLIGMAIVLTGFRFVVR